MYGYDRGTTPHLDAWSAGARVYDRMLADAAWTLPSHISLFTGLWPASHGAHGTRTEGPGGRPKLHQGVSLPAGTATVARSLRAAGYRTAGIAANQAFLDPAYGVDQGFDLWLCEQIPDDPRPVPYPPADRISALARAYLTRPAAGPRFLFLNYLDAHAPWIPRRGYVRDEAAIDRTVLPFGGSRWRDVSEDLLAHEGITGDTEAAWVEAYDAELRYLDEQVGALLDDLPKLGVGPEDYVFILSDHGEYLGEHDLVLHSRDVYDPVVHVPLLIRGPGVVPGHDATPVQHHDVATRILAAAGLPPLEGAATTVDLQVSEQYWSRGRDVNSARYGKRFDRVRRAFRVGPWSLLVGSDGSAELYNVAEDPGQVHDRAGDAPDTLAELRAKAEAWVAAHPERALTAPEEDPDNARLRALGYVQ
jgi:arylsulfatase A-like enzyme